MNSLVIGAVRRPIHPGADHEIVPEDEARKFEGTYRDGIEFFNDGIWKMAPSPNFASGCTFRRRKAKSEPAMDEGWELVPNGEVDAAITANEKHPDWQFFINDYANKQWMRSNNISKNCTYRRPKSKPVEQYGWLKPSNETPMPTEGIFEAISDSGRRGNVTFDLGINRCVWQSSGMPVAGNVEYFYRQHPAPEIEKVDAMMTAWLNHVEACHQIDESADETDFRSGWQACCDHYKVGDQSKK